MSTGTNIMGEPLRGRVGTRIELQTLDDYRAVRDAAAALCDAWSDGEDDATMERLSRQLDRAYAKAAGTP